MFKVKLTVNNGNVPAFLMVIVIVVIQNYSEQFLNLLSPHFTFKWILFQRV